MAACALLEKSPQPTDDEIRASVDSVYCRCTGYARITEAYKEAAVLARGAGAVKQAEGWRKNVKRKA